MIMSKKREIVLTLAGATLIGTLAMAAEARQPHTLTANVTHTGPAGNSVNRQTTVNTNRHGGFTSNSTWTGPLGRTVTGQQSGQYNAATKTFTDSGSLTGPNGKQATYSTTAQGNGNGGYTRQSTMTGPNGKTTTVNGQGQWNPGTSTFNQSRTTTYPNGQSSSETRSVNISPPSGN
jgi:hypothetical protein